jgi:hypothetical protein
MSTPPSSKPAQPYHVVAWKSTITILVIAPWAMTSLGIYLLMLTLSSWSSPVGPPFWAVAFVMVTAGLPCLGVYAVATSVWTDKRTKLLTGIMIMNLLGLSLALCRHGPKSLIQAIGHIGGQTLTPSAGVELYLLASGWLLCLWEITRSRETSVAPFMRQASEQNHRQ